MHIIVYSLLFFYSVKKRLARICVNFVSKRNKYKLDQNINSKTETNFPKIKSDKADKQNAKQVYCPLFFSPLFAIYLRGANICKMYGTPFEYLNW